MVVPLTTGVKVGGSSPHPLNSSMKNEENRHVLVIEAKQTMRCGHMQRKDQDTASANLASQCPETFDLYRLN